MPDVAKVFSDQASKKVRARIREIQARFNQKIETLKRKRSDTINGIRTRLDQEEMKKVVTLLDETYGK